MTRRKDKNKQHQLDAAKQLQTAVANLKKASKAVRESIEPAVETTPVVTFSLPVGFENLVADVVKRYPVAFATTSSVSTSASIRSALATALAYKAGTTEVHQRVYELEHHLAMVELENFALNSALGAIRHIAGDQ